MTLGNFIRINRTEIDTTIARALRMNGNPNVNDIERRLWILNDEGLYHWAQSEGVKI